MKENLSCKLVGAGAIGTIFAAYLVRAGINVCVAQHGTMRSEILREIRSEGRLSGKYCFPVESFSDKDTNLFLIATKAMKVLDALKLLKDSLTDKTDVLILSNGMGYHEEAEQLCKPARVFAATTTEAAYFSADGKIHHVAEGKTIIGPLSLDNPPIWLPNLENALPTARWKPDVKTALWLKFAINCVINPLTAIYGCPNGTLISEPNLHAMLKEICSEVQLVGSSTGFLTSADLLYNSVLEVINRTAENFSSMQQDMEHGRETEIESITGYLVHIASQVEIDTPLNKKLLTRIRELNG